jgi:SAM-dependent methyltransferase
MSWFARKAERVSAGPEARYQLGVPSNLFSAALPEGIYYPDFTTLADYRPPEFLSLFDAARGKPWSECTILDLGCGEGTSSTAIGSTGARVIGIEGRPEVLRRAEYVRDRLGYTNVELRAGSVLDEKLWERVDAVYASGLIHHLAEPYQLIELIGRHCGELAYFCTHLAPRSEAQRAASHFAGLLRDAGARPFRGRALPGIRFTEGGDAREEQAGRRRHPRDGIGNLESWWLAEESFVDAMKTVGFAGHARLYGNDHRLRYRYCFTRSGQAPAHLSRAVETLWASPERPAARDAARRAMAADLAFLRRARIAPAVKGDAEAVAVLSAMLREAGIATSEDPQYIVVAQRDYEALKRTVGELVTLRECRYAFASFSLARFGLETTRIDPVTGDAL